MKTKSRAFHYFLISIAVIVIGALALVGSVAAYHVLHRGEHRARLQRMLAEHPTESRIYKILGNPSQTNSTVEAIALAKRVWGDFRINPDLARRAPRTLTYCIDDMIYLILIDSDGTMVDFVLLNN